MSKTYKFMTTSGSGLVFANVQKPTDVIRFSGSSVNVPGTVNGRRVQAVKNTITMNEQVAVLPEGCTDTCSALIATLSASVSFSGPVSTKDQLTSAWANLKQAVDEAIATDNILLGFKPAATRTFVLGE
ncbi:MAG: hypothetical protein [Hangzhou levivirus 2]|uniref:Uncharacterized protein n=1 Tax=Hangzhou levivirus 2 TaxID=2905508 RepID=A0A8K1XGF8_9VIRU|nr:MAG: hypothetical protein [Hangzhou levivirus 2]UHR49860.1 MAG: hypothetical protein [Hangzhou levivirus 2]